MFRMPEVLLLEGFRGSDKPLRKSVSDTRIWAVCPTLGIDNVERNKQSASRNHQRAILPSLPHACLALND